MPKPTSGPADWERLLSEIVVLAEETFADPKRIERVKEAARQLEADVRQKAKRPVRLVPKE